MQVKKETQQLREFEEGLVSQFKFYLEDLEQTIKGTPPLCRRHRSTHSLTLIRLPFFFRLEAEEEEAQSSGRLPVVPRPGRGCRALPV